MKRKKPNYKLRRRTALLVLILLVVSIVVLTRKNIIKKNQIAEIPYGVNISGLTINAERILTEEPNVPQLGAGMIPVTYDENIGAWVITTKTNANWYDYSVGKMATVMLSDGFYKSELEVGVDESTQVVNEKNTREGTIVNNSEIGTIYVWVPRVVIKEDDTSSFLRGASVLNAGISEIPACFSYSQGQQLQIEFTGIWVERTPGNSDVTKMNSEDNKYGLIKNELVENYSIVAQNAVNKILKRKDPQMQQVQDRSNRARTMIRIVNTNNKMPLIVSSKLREQVAYINVDYTQYGIEKIICLDTGATLSTNSPSAQMTLPSTGTYEFLVVDNMGNMVSTNVRAEDWKPSLVGLRVDTTYLVIYTERVVTNKSGATETTYVENSGIPIKDILKNGYTTDANNALVKGVVDYGKVDQKLDEIEENERAKAQEQGLQVQKVNAEWYNYNKQQWANIVVRNNANEAYYTWIPRYVYQLDKENEATHAQLVSVENVNDEGEILEVNTGSADSWILPDAFTWLDENGETVQLSGYWMSKYELSAGGEFSITANIVGGKDKIKISNIVSTGVPGAVTYDVYLYRASAYGEELDQAKPQEYLLVQPVAEEKNYVENIVSRFKKNNSADEYVFEQVAGGDYWLRFVIRDSQGAYRGEKWFDVTVIENNNATAELPDLVGLRVNTTYIVTYTNANDASTINTYIPISEILANGYQVDPETNTLVEGKVDLEKVRNKLEEIKSDGGDTPVWFNYEQQKWANIVVRNEAGEAYYTWIPRYIYMLDEKAEAPEIKFVDTRVYGKRIPAGWTLPEAFTWIDQDGNEQQLSGYWMSKYELSQKPGADSGANFKISINIVPGTNKIKLIKANDNSGLDLTYRFYLYESNLDETAVFGGPKEYFAEPEVELSNTEIASDGDDNKNDCSTKRYVRYSDGFRKDTKLTEAIYYGLNEGSYDLRIVAYDSTGHYRGEEWFYNIQVVTKNDVAEKPDLVGLRVNTTYVVTYTDPNDANTIDASIPISAILKNGYIVDPQTNTLVEGKIDNNKLNAELEKIKQAQGADIQPVWFNYKEQKWANIVTRNDGGEAYYVWIPRYIYRLDNDRQESDILFVGTDIYGDKVPEGWLLPDAFTWIDDEGNTRQLTGYWMSKYELSPQDFSISIDYFAGLNKLRIRQLSDKSTLSLTYKYYLYEDPEGNDSYETALFGGTKEFFAEPEAVMTSADMAQDGDDNNNNCNGKRFVRYAEGLKKNDGKEITFYALNPGKYDLRIVAYNNKGYYMGEKWYDDIEIVAKVDSNIEALEWADSDVMVTVDTTEFDKEHTYYVTYDGSGAEVLTKMSDVANPPADWYDYDNQKWANILVENNGLKAYFVYIPRYIYKLDTIRQLSEIKLVGTDVTQENAPAGYILPDAFTWVDETGATVQTPGYWISKYELSYKN